MHIHVMPFVSFVDFYCFVLSSTERAEGAQDGPIPQVEKNRWLVE